MVLYLPDSWLNWNLEISVFEERGKLEYLEKNLSEKRREPTTNSTHICRQCQNLNQGHIGERLVLSPLHHPCSPNPRLTSQLFSGCLVSVFDFAHKLVIGTCSYYRVVQSLRKAILMIFLWSHYRLRTWCRKLCLITWNTNFLEGKLFTVVFF